MDTIYALASALGKAGVSVIRISGPSAKAVAGSLCSLPATPRQAVVRPLVCEGDILDRALVVVFEGPNSFTGEDVVEFQVHGSTAVVSAVLNALSQTRGSRLAEPGEFTRRALENEKLDLARVEGLSDLIDAETEAQRKQAARVLSGALGNMAASWRQDLIRAAALLEATIDFADEEVPVDVAPEVEELIAKVSAELNRESKGFQAAERIRAGFEVAIVGAPNVGKSTLLNALAGRDAAITSEIAGTTRDVIEVRMEIGGLPVTFLDTAGLRESDDEIEKIGIGLARKRAEQADLRVVLKESASAEVEISIESDDIVLVSKSDIAEAGDISAKTGEGVEELLDNIAMTLQGRASSAGVAIRERHRAALVKAENALGIARKQLKASSESTELVAEELRSAVRALDSLVGRVDVEDVLDEIFASFCIGK